MKFLDEIKNYSAKKAAIPLLGLMSLIGTYQANAQRPDAHISFENNPREICDIIYTDYNNDKNLDEITFEKDEKTNQTYVFLKQGDKNGNLTPFPNEGPSLIINWNGEQYVKAIINDFNNNDTQDIKFLARDDEGLKQYLFKGDGKGNFTNNPDEKYFLTPVQNN